MKERKAVTAKMRERYRQATSTTCRHRCRISRPGKLVALAVAAPKRLDVLPNVPTLGELGLSLKEVNDQAWYGLVAPAKTPDAIIKKLYDATVTVLRSNDIKEKFALQGATPVGNTPVEYLAQIRAEYEKMSAIVKKKGITLES